MFMCMDNAYGFSNAKYEVIFEKKRGNFNKSYELRVVVVVDKLFTLRVKFNIYILFFVFVRIFFNKKHTIRHVLFLSRLYNIIYAHNNHIFKEMYSNC